MLDSGSKIVFETERLALRELSATDLDFVADMLSHPEVMRHYPKPLTREESRNWIAKLQERYARDGCGLWGAAERHSRQLVGQVGVLLQDVDGQQLMDVGYLLHQDYWGRGYATEAARASFDHAFGTRGCDEVVSLIRPENKRSQAVAERLGLKVMRRTQWRGFLHDIYVLDRSHWETR